MLSLKIASTVAAAALFLGWFFLFRPTELAGPASYIVVSGHSMEPTFYTGDLLVLREQDDYQVGDVVAYYANGGRIIHRIVGGNAKDGFVMQGDNNSYRTSDTDARPNRRQTVDPRAERGKLDPGQPFAPVKRRDPDKRRLRG